MTRGSRGRGRGNYNTSVRHSDAPGPLMTEHIRNLDMELELLKRKREMIEQQQQLLDRQMDYSSQRQYNAPMFWSNNDSASNLNFSLMYDDQSTPDYIPLNSGSRKRPIESTWRDNSLPKRFSGPFPKRGNAKKTTGSQPGPSANPASTSNANTRYYEAQSAAGRKKPPPSQKPKITPTQSFKSKPSAPPNKLNTYSVAERKSLVTKAVKATKDAMVLLPDVTPSLQLNGRLELALGHLLKEIKTKYSCIPPYSLTFMSQSTMKAMKTLIRKRIRDVMMGKEVGGLPEIVTVYRERYPLESDVDIVNEGLAQQDLGDVKNILKTPPEGSPKDHFKENISLMVELKLHQMFLQLSKIYSKDAPTGETTVELTPIPKSEDTDFSKDVTVDVQSSQVNDKEENVSKENDGKAPEGQEEKEKEDMDIQDKDVISEAKEVVSVEDKKNISKDDTSLKKEENISKDNEQNIPKEKKEAADMKDKSVTLNKETKENVVLDRLIEKILPGILKKHIAFIKTLMNFDEMYDALVKKKPLFEVDAKRTETPPKYFAKVYCRKGFPNKFAMQDFLDPFEPKCVKKLKSMHNLLFVGFDDKEAFEKLLAANGTTIGKFTLQITVSENKKDKKPQKTKGDKNKNGEADEKKDRDVDKDKNEKADDAINEEDDENKNDQPDDNDKDVENVDSTDDATGDDKIISADMDNQITDLLTSIKHGENSPNSSFVVDEDEDNAMDVDKDNVQKSDSSSENTDSKNDKTDNTDSKAMQQNGDNEKTVATQDIVETEPKTPVKKMEVIEEHEENTGADNDDQNKTVDAVKSELTVKGTPTKTSGRAVTATPSTIRTRRASRLAQNNQ